MWFGFRGCVWLLGDFICLLYFLFFFFFQAEDGIRDLTVTGVQTCALPISAYARRSESDRRRSGGAARALASRRQRCRPYGGPRRASHRAAGARAAHRRRRGFACP